MSRASSLKEMLRNNLFNSYKGLLTLEFKGDPDRDRFDKLIENADTNLTITRPEDKKPNTTWLIEGRFASAKKMEACLEKALESAFSELNVQQVTIAYCFTLDVDSYTSLDQIKRDANTHFFEPQFKAWNEDKGFY